jgi:hypothetical protein
MRELVRAGRNNTMGIKRSGPLASSTATNNGTAGVANATATANAGAGGFGGLRGGNGGSATATAGDVKAPVTPTPDP